MDKSLPDKWVRKSIFDVINNITVDGVVIPCYDTRVPNNENPPHYVLMTTQTNNTSKLTKCEDSYESSILLDIITSYNSIGNTGSRLLADNICDAVRNLTKNLVLDVSSGLKIIRQTQDFPNDLNIITDVESVYRKFIRIEMFIN